MIEHEPHFVSVAVDAGDAAPERLHQVIERREQDIGQDGAFQVAPEAFNQIQTRAVRRRPTRGKNRMSSWMQAPCETESSWRFRPFLRPVFGALKGR